MRRREFITLLGSAAALASPRVARAQQPATPVIGFLHVRSPDTGRPPIRGLRSGLAETGYVEGKSVTLEYRWGSGRYDQMPAMALELARRPVDILVAGADAAALAAKAATSTIPIVFAVGADPVAIGLVASFNRPGGNATGVNILTTALEAKRLGLLRELVPQAAMIAALLNPDLEAAASAGGVRLQVLWASNNREIDTAFDTIAQQSIGALVVTANPFFDTSRDHILALAARHVVPTMYQLREYVTAGGLMSYGVDLPSIYHQVGVYAGRILKGAKPAGLPVLLPTKFEFVLNLKTAKALGVKISDNLLSLADEVIE
jgi:putative tryptophan/tyrosine transport system substrate-binding protein